MSMKAFLREMEAQDNLNPTNNTLRTEMEDYMEKMQEMNALVEMIQPLEAKRCHPRQAMILPGLAGIGIGFLAKILFGHPNQKAIISGIKENKNVIIMLNADRLVFQEHKITWDNKIMNELKNFSKAIDKKIHWQRKRTTDDEHRSFLIWC